MSVGGQEEKGRVWTVAVNRKKVSVFRFQDPEVFPILTPET